MTRDEIEEFSGVELNCFETDREEDWYKIGCIDGLNAADEHPNLEKFWHNVKESPESGVYFIAEDYKGNLDAFCWIDGKDADWIDYFKQFNLKRWAYMKDFLPKNDIRKYEDNVYNKESTKFESFKLKQSKNNPRYRMFKDSEECWQEMFKHEPFGWIKTKSEHPNFLLIDNLSDEGYLARRCTFPFSFKTLFEICTFADGTPFGIKED